jgi:hypothetical protein
VKFLLEIGQPIEHARVPALDLHIEALRRHILNHGIQLIEVRPAPAGYAHAVCLTHDIDFVGIRHHLFDHTMWGFIYRATVGTIRSWLTGRLALKRVVDAWRAVASLPFVFIGWAEDFWRPFQWYLDVEKGLPATYFVIPFKRRRGQGVKGIGAWRRGTAYDVSDIPDSVAALSNAGCEVGVHGIDAWHSPKSGREEYERVAVFCGRHRLGVRMHWLLRDQCTAAVLDDAGYAYDSTVGYNETIGYRAGTGQVFRPLGSRMLLELPLHIQDGALFFPQQLDLRPHDAWLRCDELIENARRLGGVLTLLWHDRSHAAERFWGDFYRRLVEALKASPVWFATAFAVVEWFRKRRAVQFGRRTGETDGSVIVRYAGDRVQPPFLVRIYHGPSTHTDLAWDGMTDLTSSQLLHLAAGVSTEVSSVELCSAS